MMCREIGQRDVGLEEFSRTTQGLAGQIAVVLAEGLHRLPAAHRDLHGYIFSDRLHDPRRIWPKRFIELRKSTCIPRIDIQDSGRPIAVAGPDRCQKNGITPKAPHTLVAARVDVSPGDHHDHSRPAR